MMSKVVKSKNFLLDIRDPFFADMLSEPNPKWQCLSKGIQSFTTPTPANSPAQKHNKSTGLYQEGPLRFSGLRHRHIKWIQEITPLANITEELVPGGLFMQKVSTFSGVSTYVTFASKSDAMLFKLTWWK